jgi:hypothetical protein
VGPRRPGPAAVLVPIAVSRSPVALLVISGREQGSLISTQ